MRQFFFNMIHLKISCTPPIVNLFQVKVACECKTRKIDSLCDKVRSGYTLCCDETCKAKRDQIRLAAEENDRKQRELEEEKNRLELLEYEKKFGKKKYKERKQYVVEEEAGWLNKKNLIILSICSIFVAIAVAIFLMNSN